MNILYHFTVEHLKKNKKRTITTIIGVVISTALICGSSILAASFQDMFLREAIENNGNYHAAFIDVPADSVKYISENDNVEESMISENIGYAIIGSQNEYKPYVYVKAYDETSMEEQPIHLLEGRFPENSNEILLPEHIISNGNVKVEVGDEITLDLGNRFMEEVSLSQNDPYDSNEVFISDESEKYIVTGIIQRPEFEQFSAPGYTAITYLDKETLTKDDVVNISVLVKNPRNIYEIAPVMAQKAGLNLEKDELGEVSNITYNNDLLRWLGISDDQMFVMSFYYVLFIIIPLIALGSISVIYNAFTISVSERKKQFGMLISVGATPRQIRKTIIFEGIIITLIGIPIGILGGITGIKITLIFANNLLSQIYEGMHQIQMVVSPLVIMLTIISTGLIIFISAYLPSKKASKISPVEVIRANDELSSNKMKLSTGWLTRKLFGIEGEIALKTLKRNKRKYRTTIFSIFISVVMFISVSSFMEYTIKGSETYSTEYNFAVYLNESTDNQGIIDYLSQNPETKKISIVKSVPGDIIVKKSNLTNDALDKFSNKFILENNDVRIPVTIYSIGEKSFSGYLDTLHLNDKDFTDQQDASVILINRTTSYWDVDGKINKTELDVLNFKDGDNTKIYQSHDLINEESPKDLNSLNVKIISVTGEKPFGFDNEQGPIIIVKNEDYSEIETTLYGDSADYEDSDISVYIKSDNTDHLEEMYLSKAKESGIVAPSYFNQEKSDRSTLMLIRLIQLFFYGFITLITLIGVTNIFNTIATNIQLRNREFAILQSTGLTPGGLNKILFLESAFYGIKALSYGLPVSIGISYLLYKNINNGIINYISYSLPWNAMGICIISVFIIVYSTMMYASSKTKKTSIIDVIRNENI